MGEKGVCQKERVAVLHSFLCGISNAHLAVVARSAPLKNWSSEFDPTPLFTRRSLFGEKRRAEFRGLQPTTSLFFIFVTRSVRAFARLNTIAVMIIAKRCLNPRLSAFSPRATVPGAFQAFYGHPSKRTNDTLRVLYTLYIQTTLLNYSHKQTDKCRLIVPIIMNSSSNTSSTDGAGVPSSGVRDNHEGGSGKSTTGQPVVVVSKRSKFMLHDDDDLHDEANANAIAVDTGKLGFWQAASFAINMCSEFA